MSGVASTACTIRFQQHRTTSHLSAPFQLAAFSKLTAGGGTTSALDMELIHMNGEVAVTPPKHAFSFLNTTTGGPFSKRTIVRSQCAAAIPKTSESILSVGTAFTPLQQQAEPSIWSHGARSKLAVGPPSASAPTGSTLKADGNRRSSPA